MGGFATIAEMAARGPRPLDVQAARSNEIPFEEIFDYIGQARGLGSSNRELQLSDIEPLRELCAEAVSRSDPRVYVNRRADDALAFVSGDATSYMSTLHQFGAGKPEFAEYLKRLEETEDRFGTRGVGALRDHTVYGSWQAFPHAFSDLNLGHTEYGLFAFVQKPEVLLATTQFPLDTMAKPILSGEMPNLRPVTFEHTSDALLAHSLLTSGQPSYFGGASVMLEWARGPEGPEQAMKLALHELENPLQQGTLYVENQVRGVTPRTTEAIHLQSSRLSQTERAFAPEIREHARGHGIEWIDADAPRSTIIL